MGHVKTTKKTTTVTEKFDAEGKITERQTVTEEETQETVEYPKYPWTTTIGGGTPTTPYTMNVVNDSLDAARLASNITKAVKDFKKDFGLG